jgi:TM2 domain-containing membrane protein YozV
MSVDNLKPNPVRSKSVAGWLAIILGGLGAHKFYLGKWTGGIYILFLPTLLPIGLGVIEGVIILSRSHIDWNNEYLVKEVNSIKAILLGVCVFALPFLLIGLLAAIFMPHG